MTCLFSFWFFSCAIAGQYQRYAGDGDGLGDGQGDGHGHGHEKISLIVNK